MIATKIIKRSLWTISHARFTQSLADNPLFKGAQTQYFQGNYSSAERTLLQLKEQPLSPEQYFEMIQLLSQIQEKANKGDQLLATKEEMFFIGMSITSLYADDQQSAFRSLFRTYIQQEQIKRCQATLEMLAELEIPLAYRNEIIGLEGTLKLVQCQVDKGSELLQESIDSGIKLQVLATAQNNLGYAYTLKSADVATSDPIQSKDLLLKALVQYTEAIMNSEMSQSTPAGQSTSASPPPPQPQTDSLAQPNVNQDMSKLCLQYLVDQSLTENPKNLQTLAKQSSIVNVTSPLTQKSIMNLADALLRLGRLEAAQTWLQILLKSALKKTEEKANISRGFVLLAASAIQKPELAETILLDLLESNTNSYSQMSALSQYSDLLSTQGRAYEAEEYMRQSYSIFKQLSPNAICLEHLALM